MGSPCFFLLLMVAFSPNIRDGVGYGSSVGYILYLDELGCCDAGGPNNEGWTPLFGLAGICLFERHVRPLTKWFAERVERTFSHELAVWRHQCTDLAAVAPDQRDAQWERRVIAAGVAGLPSTRWQHAEHFEIKGQKLFGARALVQTSRHRRRGIAFGQAVLRYLAELQPRPVVFGRVLVKRTDRELRHDSIYGKSFQGVLLDLHNYLERERSTGIVIADARTPMLDGTLLSSAQSYIFMNHLSIRDTPYVSDSRWHVGLQIADLVCNIAHSAFRHLHCQATHLSAIEPLWNEVGTLVDRGDGRESLYIELRSQNLGGS